MSDLMTTIGHIAEVFDGPHATPTKTDVGPYFLSISSLESGRLDLSKSARLSEEDFKRWTKRVTPRNGDLLFSYETRLGEAALVPDGIRACLGRRMGLLRPRPGKVIPEYFLYAYLSPAFQQTIVANTITGATVDRIALNEISDFPIRIPGMAEQKRVANLLKNIDAKIDCNNRINAELEAMAKTLYDYWFVQFDFPDTNGKPYKSSGGKMVYNAALKREIPEGWELTTLERIESNIITGKTPTKTKPEYFSGSIPFITIGDIRGNTFIINTVEFLSRAGANSQKGKYLPENSICVSCIASPGLVGFVTEEAQTNQQINSVVCQKEYTRYFLYFAINDFFTGSKAKTGNTFANMNKGDFAGIPTIEPDIIIINKFHCQVLPVFENIKCRTKENQQLAQLRDWLLPLLMNGQVTVA
jgi:type I restriction enzyme, S subunit